MARPSRSDFEALTALVENKLDAVTYHRLDFRDDRAIWEIHGSYQQFDIRVKEIHNQGGRMYSYYVLQQGEIVFGYDNYPDRRALREKYGDEFSTHLDELIPHRHGIQKLTIELTQEISLADFLFLLPSR